MTKKAPTEDQLQAIPAEVPMHYVKDAYVNYDWEKMQCLGLSLHFDEVDIKPPSLGVWTVLELIDARAFVMDYPSATPMDVARALYINEFRQKAAREASLWLLEDNSAKERYDTEWDKSVKAWAGKMMLFSSPESLAQIYEWFVTAWNGLTMFPQGAVNRESDWFGAVKIGQIVAAVGSSINLTPAQLLWDTPVCLVSHTMAQSAIMNGTKFIARPKDPEDVKHKLRETKEKIFAGELLQWQVDDPLNRQLTPHQKQYGGARLIREFEKLVEAASKKGK